MPRPADRLQPTAIQPAFDKSRLHYMSRTEKFRAGLAKEKRLAQLLIELDWDQKDHNLAESLLGEC